MNNNYNISNVRLCINQKGGTYCNGLAYQDVYRERILDLYHNNVSQRQIAIQLRVSRRYVQKVIEQYVNTNTSLRTPRSEYPTPKINDDVLEYASVLKTYQPSIYASEIRDRMLLDGVTNDLPSARHINRRIRKDLVMTKKKITVVPSESVTPVNVQRVNDYLQEISYFQANQLHFFDESSVIKTTGNRSYGNSMIGERAVEVQKYASNATYTINLLHSMRGVDLFNVVDGPSNGFELLSFFEDAVEVQRQDGSVLLERGNGVVMDNCGFHHGHFVEPILRDLLADFGVVLIYQPPYSPHLNTCELCFNQMKDFLKLYPTLANEETKIAIAEGITRITGENSFNYFKHCGYV